MQTPKIFNILSRIMLFLSFFCALVGCTSESKTKDTVNEGQTSTTFSTDRLDKEVTSLMDSADIPGLALSIIQKGDIVYSKGYGLTKSDSTAKVTEHTIFNAASLSKPVFAYAVLKLVEEGKLTLDTPLYKYLPYKDISYDERYKKITARMCLSHTTGFPNWRSNDKLIIGFTPGEKFSYSGEGFVYLQKVVEKLTGKPLEEVMQEKVFTPLGMNRSSYIWRKDFDNNFAFPHDMFSVPDEKGKSPNANAAYSLQTTASDYARFLIGLIHHTGLKESSIQEMLTTQIAVPVSDTANSPLLKEISWGLGIGLQQTPDRKVFWHWGDNNTYKCFVAVDPEAQDGIIYFTNSYNGLSVIREMVQQAIPGEHPAVAYLDYEWYKSPASIFAKNIVTKGVASAITPFLDERGKSTLDEEKMNRIGNRLMYSGKVKEALEVFSLNKEAYPASADVYFNYANALLRNGNTAEAKENYNKSLQLKTDNSKARQILSGLQKAQAKKGSTRVVLKGHPDAKFVSLAGSFNDWDDMTTFCSKNGDVWECYADLAPGTYRYRFVKDGDWILDPANPSSDVDEYGNTNSLLIVKKP